MKRKALLLAMIMILSLLVSACGDNASGSGTGSGTGNSSSGEVQSDNVITIGAVLPLSGSNATTGANLQAAMQVAEDIINNAHDIDWDVARNEGVVALDGAKIQLDFADCQSDASVASTEAASLLDKGVSAIVGAYSSGYSASVGTMAMEYNVPMVCGSSSSASLTDGSTYPFANVFNRVAANDEMESIEFFEFLTYLNDNYDAGIETVALAWINNAYGTHADEMFQKYAAQYGFTVVANVSYDSDITAADTEAATIKAANPDVVFQASYIGDLTLFAQAYDSLDFQPTLIMCYCGGFQDASFAAVATQYGANYYAGGQACSAVLAEKMEVFSYINDLYKAKTGLDIDGVALEEFASVVVAVQAMVEAGTTDADAVIGVLKSSIFDAPYLTAGSIRFDENGQNAVMASFITQLIDGKYQVVYPIDEFVTAEPLV